MNTDNNHETGRGSLLTNDLQYIALLSFVDFPFSFGVRQLFWCIPNMSGELVGGLTLALTIIVNLSIHHFVYKR